MKKASISDVSKRAGVSTATVSRVLNTPDRVAEDTRNRVLEAISELNFVKSATAFSFKSQQTRNVLVSCQRIGNIYWSEVFEGIQRRANQHGYNIIIRAAKDRDDEDPVVSALRAGSVDGVIAFDEYQPSPDNAKLLHQLFAGTPPIVGFAEKKDILDYPHIWLDNRTAARKLTEHLIESGHRQIGHLPGPDGTSVAQERMSGFFDAMSKAGLRVDPEDIYEGGFHRDVGRRVARRLARRRVMPTAVFCANDETAMGFMSELSILGIRVPDDISVAGFDNNVLADVYIPALTTMAQPRGEIGASAMDLLFDVINDPVANARRVVELKIRLAIRQSVARIAGGPSPN